MMKKSIFTLMAAMVLPMLAMAQCPPSSTTAKVTFQFIGPGRLDGEFSVSAIKKVIFSKGNLQFKASTNTWRFAEHQWDYVGDLTNGNVYENEEKCSNTKVSASYAGWIDLFPWGTSGNPASNLYGYMPYYLYSTSDQNKCSSMYGPSTLNGDWTPEYSDWGVVNADQLGVGWRTLTQAEMQYLQNSRTNAGKLCSKANIHGVNGMIFLPDKWTQADSHLAKTFTYSSSYQTFTDEEWDILESEGAVFLPAAGNRTTTSTGGVNNTGYYWLSRMTSGSNQAVRAAFYFNGSSYSSSNTYNRYFGHSVRLVKEL